MAQLKSKPRKTLEDYLKLPEGTRAELIEGEIFMSPSPRVRHQRIVLKLSLVLNDYARKTGSGEVFVAPLDVHLPMGDVVQPDLIFVSEAKRAIVQDWVRGVPDLLVEVLSPEGADRDEIIKRDLYARAGVREYWIVDGDARAVEVLTLAGGRYQAHGYFQAPATLASKALPDLAAALSEIFE